MDIVKPFGKKVLTKLIAQIYKRYHTTETSIMLDKLKDLGFKHSTLSGISIGIGDIIESKDKKEILASATEKV